MEEQKGIFIKKMSESKLGKPFTSMMGWPKRVWEVIPIIPVKQVQPQKPLSTLQGQPYFPFTKPKLSI